MLIEHAGKRPAIDPTAWVAPDATLCGDITIGPGVRILHGARLVGEAGGAIRVGREAIIMENAVIRASIKHPCTIGDHCLIGPNAHVTGATLEDEVFVATGAAIFHGALFPVERPGPAPTLNATHSRPAEPWSRRLDRHVSCQFSVSLSAAPGSLFALQSVVRGAFRLSILWILRSAQLRPRAYFFANLLYRGCSFTLSFLRTFGSFLIIFRMSRDPFTRRTASFWRMLRSFALSLFNSSG
jgi:Hexapeptide repeat of succinyl-transferase